MNPDTPGPRQPQPAPGSHSTGCRQWLTTRHCGRPARLYPAGWRCPQHSPATQAGTEEPPSTPMEPPR
ncbi:hypothetical protein EDD38_7490 [Kitasatospora cineracea]|uniref:Uncharacterized protein n=1 Tax=Kitasatospora cineracea TaxID=88074 RepID=A0A3N4R8Q0_9ACTN|nr:hypothetical protein EDD38_7359 [Kitasatospora cineracea]RPE27345.1 hypothetical protein EDD38_7490 [Kitasatospora cineracea]